MCQCILSAILLAHAQTSPLIPDFIYMACDSIHLNDPYKIDGAFLHFSDAISNVNYVYSLVFYPPTEMGSNFTFDGHGDYMLPSLVPSVPYTVQIHLTGSDGSAKSNTCRIKISPRRPRDPICRHALFSNISARSITLNLSNVISKGASVFIVRMSAVNGGSVNPVIRQTSINNTLFFEKLDPGSFYQFKILAKNAYNMESLDGCNFKISTKPGNPHCVGFSESTATSLMLYLNETISEGADYLRIQLQLKNGTTLQWTINSNRNAVQLDGLDPDTAYTFDVRAYTGNGRQSDENCSLIVNTKPLDPDCSMIRQTEYTMASVSFRFGSQSFEPDQYKILVQNVSKVNYTSQTMWNTTEIRNLTPGKEYDFSVYKVGSHGERSTNSCHFKQLLCTTVRPSSVKITGSNSSTITIQLAPPQELVNISVPYLLETTSIKHRCSSSDSGTVNNSIVTYTEFLPLNTDLENIYIVVNGLYSFSGYVFRIKPNICIQNGSQWSNSVFGKTAETVPDSIDMSYTEVHNITSSSVAITWRKPCLSNGVILLYEIQTFAQKDRIDRSEYTQLLLDKLLPKTRYSFRIRAINSAGNGNWSEWKHFRTTVQEVTHNFHGDIYDVKMTITDLSSTICRVNIFWKIAIKNLTKDTLLRYYVSYRPQTKPSEKVSLVTQLSYARNITVKSNEFYILQIRVEGNLNMTISKFQMMFVVKDGKLENVQDASIQTDVGISISTRDGLAGALVVLLLLLGCTLVILWYYRKQLRMRVKADTVTAGDRQYTYQEIPLSETRPSTLNDSHLYQTLRSNVGDDNPVYTEDSREIGITETNTLSSSTHEYVELTESLTKHLKRPESSTTPKYFILDPKHTRSLKVNKTLEGNYAMAAGSTYMVKKENSSEIEPELNTAEAHNESPKTVSGAITNFSYENVVVRRNDT